MSFDLIRMLPHPNRSNDEEVMVLIKKSNKRAKDDTVDMTLFRMNVYLLDAVKKKSEGFDVVKFGAKPVFDVVANHINQSVGFTLGEMGQLLPPELRGGGLGSLLMTELIKWRNANFPDYTVLPIRVFAPPDEDGGSIHRNKAFLKKMGFSLVENAVPNKAGLYGVVTKAGGLSGHSNTQKVEHVDMADWLNDLTATRMAMGNQLVEEVNNAQRYRTELQRQKENGKGKMSFWAGLMLGISVGVVVALLIPMR